MKKLLTKTQNNLYHYKNGEKVEGKNSDMSGNCTDLFGNCTDLFGNCSGLSGDCTGLRGDLDACEIIDEERERGINIQDLIKE